MRVRIRYSQVVVNEPPRWIINGTNATVEKYGIDQQERDLKLGWFPVNKDFGQDHDQHKCTIYYLDGTTENFKLEEKLYYNQFFLAFKNCIEANTEPPVTKAEALTVINILETIVNKAQYRQLEKNNVTTNIKQLTINSEQVLFTKKRRGKIYLFFSCYVFKFII